MEQVISESVDNAAAPIAGSRRVDGKADAASRDRGLRKSLRFFATTVVIAVSILVVLGAWACVRLGSLRAGFAYLAGTRMILDHQERSFGEVAGGEERTVSFRLTNFSQRPVRVLGAKTECTCMVADELPLTIGISETATLKVTVRKGSKTGELRETIRFYTDHPGRSEIAVRLFGRILE